MTVGLGVDVQPDRRGMVISQRLLSDDAVRDVQEVAVALQWAEMTLAVFGEAPDEGEVTEEWPGKEREGKASALSFARCRARLRAILAQTSAARIGRGSLIGLRPGDLLPLRAFRNDDEGRLPVPAARGVRLERVDGPRAGWHRLDVLGAGQALRRIDRQRAP